MGITPQDVLLDMVDRLKADALEASRRGIKNATALALEAERLTVPVTKLPFDDMIDAMGSIARGLEFGLAKIVEDEAQAYFRNVINMATGFAGSLISKL